MEEEHREVIRTNLFELGKQLDSKDSGFLNHLLSTHTLTDDHYEQLVVFIHKSYLSVPFFSIHLLNMFALRMEFIIIIKESFLYCFNNCYILALW